VLLFKVFVQIVLNGAVNLKLTVKTEIALKDTLIF